MRIIIALIVVCLLGSCTSVNKGLLIKRKYNKGYYLNIASHKKTNVKEIPSIALRSEEEKVEIIKIEKQQEEIIKTSSEMLPATTAYIAPHTRSGMPEVNAPEHQTNFISPKQKLQIAVNETRSGSKYDEIKFGVWVILFVILSFLYALAIVVRNPGIPFLIALLVGMLGALLTMVTGVLWL